MTPGQLRARRDKLGLTQEKLALRLAVDRVTVARWEAGALPIDKRTAMAMDYLMHLASQAAVCPCCGEPFSEHELRCND